MASKSFRYQRARPRVSSIHELGMVLAEPLSPIYGELSVQNGSSPAYMPYDAKTVWPYERTAPKFIAADLSTKSSESAGNIGNSLSRVRKQLERAREDYPNVPLILIADERSQIEAYDQYPDSVLKTTSLDQVLYAANRAERLRRELPNAEDQTLVMYADGKSRMDIANELFLSIDSIKRYTLSLFRRLSVGTQVAAVHSAFKQGLFASPDVFLNNPENPWPLTETETAIIYALGELGSQTETAWALGVSEHTVKSHLKTVRSREGWRPTYASKRLWVTGACIEAKGLAKEKNLKNGGSLFV